jgi:FdhD protein
MNPPLVEEIPLAITINDVNFSVMMVSPHDLDDFAVGYLFSEGVITADNQIHDIQSNPLEFGINVNIVLANRQHHLFQQQQRTLKGASGCGLCGKEAMDFAFPQMEMLELRPCLSSDQIAQLKPQLKQWQTLATQSGALHGAFWIDKHGKILACREDIGRHNAVDKLIGCALRRSYEPEQASILVTSRCSVEIVQKAICSKVSSLISLASPTQLAVDFANRYNLNLIHIPRQDAPRRLTSF